jgi:cysteine desulfurase
MIKAGRSKKIIKGSFGRFFDYAASSPPFPEAVEEFSQCSLTYIGNPSSAHEYGRAAVEKLHETKSELSQLLGLSGGYLVQTSGGTEANNLVIRGVMEKYPNGRLLLATDVHESAWFATKNYAKRTEILPIGRDGKINTDTFEKYINSKTVLCSVLFCNNETGIIHDIDKLGAICDSKGILFHCDGVQAIGHIPLNLGSLAYDYFTFSAHKFAGVRGTGGIFLRRGDIIPQIEGGGQEQKLRAGTENLPGLSATLKALKMSIDILEDEDSRLRQLAGKFVSLLRESIRDLHLNSDLANGLPGLISVSFPDVKGSELVTELDLRGFSISSGSACHSGEMTPSRVISNMGHSDKLALGTLRISMGRLTKEQQVEALARALIKAVISQRVLG